MVSFCYHFGNSSFKIILIAFYPSWKYPLFMRVGSLFAGVGGFDLVLKNHGCEIAWANEIDKYACKTYTANHKSKLICDDIKNVDPHDLERVDIITAGFPCQSFSIAGKQTGFDDPRGQLFFDILRFVKVLEPNIVLLENVSRLVTHDNGNTFKVITESIGKLGYIAKYKVLNTSIYSRLPQNRDRVFLVFFKDKNQSESFNFPSAVPIKERYLASDLFEKKVDDYFYYTNYKYYSMLKESVRTNAFYQLWSSVVRENKSKLCPTLTANMGTGGHNVPIIHDGRDIRKLTPRECFRLQGFPDAFVLPNNVSNSQLYKQVGNSISIPVVEGIAQGIVKAIDI